MRLQALTLFAPHFSAHGIRNTRGSATVPRPAMSWMRSKHSETVASRQKNTYKRSETLANAHMSARPVAHTRHRTQVKRQARFDVDDARPNAIPASAHPGARNPKLRHKFLYLM